MAINPNILLTPATADIGNTLIKGFQTGQQLAQSYQQARQEAELQPMRQRLLQAQLSQAEAQAAGAPAEAEARRIANEQAIMKMRVQGAAMAIPDVLKYIQNNDLQGLESWAAQTPLLMDDDKAELIQNAKAGNVNGILQDVYNVRESAYNFGIFERPKEESVSIKPITDPSTGQQKFGRFDAQGNFLGVVEGAAPPERKAATTQVVVNQGAQDLPANVLKNIDDAVSSSANLQLEAGKLTDLADRIAGTQFATSGVAAQLKDFFVNSVGGSDQETVLRQEFTRLRNSQVVKSLPPGPATDKDIAIFAEGFEKATASPERLQQFLRGAAKLQIIESRLNEAKADWWSNNRSLSRAKESFQAGQYEVNQGESFLDLQKRIVEEQNNIFSEQAKQRFLFPQGQQPQPQGPSALDAGLLKPFVSGSQPASIQAGTASQATPSITSGFTLRGSRPAGQ